MGSGEDGYIYTEPKSSSNVDYNPFAEDYLPASPVGEEFMQEDVVSKGSSSKKTSTSRSASNHLRDIAWSDMANEGDFMIGAMSRVEPSQYKDIPAATFSEGINLSAFVDDDDSQLEFVPYSPVQQSLNVETKMSFCDVMPLGGGQVMAVSSGRCMIVDMCRAKERLLYDGYVSMLQAGSCASQKLLFPEELILSEDDYALLEHYEVEFAALGFDIELLGEGRLSVSGIPSNIVGEQMDVLLYDMLREVEQHNNVGERIREDLARVMAVKGSRKVVVQDRAQAQEMLDRLCECENYSFSPSGKAIMAEFTTEELRKKLN
jgi:DNA mismatch repair protein MutL